MTSLYVAGNIQSLSDQRDKTNVQPLLMGPAAGEEAKPNALKFVNALNPVSFTWQCRVPCAKDGKDDVGFLAQELLQAQEDCRVVVPNLVDTHDADRLTVSYVQLIPCLVQALKEMSRQREEDVETMRGMQETIAMLSGKMEGW